VPNVAVMLVTHFFNEAIMALFERLRSQAPEGHDVFLAINVGGEPLSPPPGSEALGDALFLSNTSSLLALGYPEKCKPEGWDGTGWTVVPTNVDLIAVSFQQHHPGYDYYWGVEYDVHYEGDWGFLFRRFATSDADLLGTTLYRAADTPHKPMPPPLVLADGVQPATDDVVRGFFPIYRLSNRLLCAIDQEYRGGCNGNSELTWGTIAKRHGLTIEDIGGNGSYVQPQNRDVFYFNTLWTISLSPGTFVFRPGLTRIPRRENTLWHPVKPTGTYFNWIPVWSQGWDLLDPREWIKPVLWKTIVELWFRYRWRRADSATAEGT
jgi:hypothetical protein